MGPSHRFLIETACKLSDDAIRVDGHDQGGSPFPSEPPLQSGRGGCAEGARDADLFRKAFLEEARDVVRSMQAVTDSASVTHFASRFDDWRKVDMKATAQIQDHVKQLARINRSFEQFLEDCVTPTKLGEFQCALAGIVRCVDELTAARAEMGATATTVTEQVTEKVVEAWGAEREAVTEQLRRHIDDQGKHWSMDSERWTSLDRRFDALQRQMADLFVELQRQSLRVDGVEAACMKVGDATRHALQEATGVQAGRLDAIQRLLGEMSAQVNAQVGDLRDIVDAQKRDKELSAATLAQACRQVANATTESEQRLERLLKGSAETSQKSLRHLDDTLCGGVHDDPPEASKSVTATLRKLEARFTRWEATTGSDAAQWREAAADLRADLQKSHETLASQADEWSQQVEQGKQEAAELHEQIVRLKQNIVQKEQELMQAEMTLAAARDVSLSNGLKRLHGIEARGNVRINLHSGELQLLKGVEFVPPGKQSSTPPSPHFIDSRAAELALADVVEIHGLFGLSLGVEVRSKPAAAKGQGVAKKFWEDVAVGWANFLTEELVKGGVPREHLSARGVMGGKDQATNSVLVQLDRDCFPAEEAPALASKNQRGKSASPSPKPARGKSPKGK